MSDYMLLYSTFANRTEALSMARRLLENRLIACANIHEGVSSFYRWEGKIAEEEEVALYAKTTKNQIETAIAFIKQHHSYELPCIIATPITQGFMPYLTWIGEETKDQG